jgi:hypothetical protein
MAFNVSFQEVLLLRFLESEAIFIYTSTAELTKYYKILGALENHEFKAAGKYMP